ncbi:MAG TPA: hypothetical protein VF981_08375 [Gemmatimonadaceae bacterium]
MFGEFAVYSHGAKPSFLIEDRIDDGDWLSELVRRTAQQLPDPKSKKRRPTPGPASTECELS